MANVIIGISGVILFIGLALAGASLFGANVSGSVKDSQAHSVIQTLVGVSRGVVTINRDTETATSAATDSSVLVPVYVNDLPVSPIDGTSVQLLSSSGSNSSGVAAYAAVSIPSSYSGVCDSISNVGGGGGTAPTQGSLAPQQVAGCVHLSGAFGPYPTGTMVAFARID